MGQETKTQRLSKRWFIGGSGRLVTHGLLAGYMARMHGPGKKHALEAAKGKSRGKDTVVSVLCVLLRTTNRFCCRGWSWRFGTSMMLSSLFEPHGSDET